MVRALDFKQDYINVWFPQPEYTNLNNTANETADKISQNNADNKTEGTHMANENKQNNSCNEADPEETDCGVSKKITAEDWPRYVYVYFTTADETRYESDRLVDFSTFISSIGGNLGLFMGFSFMGMIFALFGWIERRYRN